MVGRGLRTGWGTVLVMEYCLVWMGLVEVVRFGATLRVFL